MKHEAPRGMALVAALVVAAVVAAVASVLGNRLQLLIAGASQAQAQQRALMAVGTLESEAMALLAADATQGPADSAQEAWSRQRFVMQQEGLAAHARLIDRQGLFNLNTLAFEPGASSTAARKPRAGSEEGGGERSAALDALRAVAAAHGLALGRAPAAARGNQAIALLPHEIAAARLVLLCQAVGVDPGIVPAVLDWVDADQDTRFPNGAEDDYYSGLKETPYRAANRRFGDPSELLRVRGVTPAIYAKLRPFVTVLDAPTPINLNTAPAEVLMSLAPTLDRDTVTTLLRARDVQPGLEVQNFLALPMLAGRAVAPAGLAVASSTFDLLTRVEQREGTVYFRSVIRRSGNRDLRVLWREKSYEEP